MGVARHNSNSIMSNVQFYLDSLKQKLNISYCSLDKLHGFVLDGDLSSDGKTFLARPEAIDSCNDLSLTERQRIKSHVSRESKDPNIVFL